MTRTTHMPRVWAGTAGVLMIVVLAASSGTIRLWTDPQPEAHDPVAEAADEAPVTRLVPELDGGALPSWVSAVVEAAAWAAIVVVLAGALVAATRLQWWLPVHRLRRRLLPSWAGAETLPADSRAVLDIDIDAALVALSDGEPRNAIVACWMRLERDAATMGFPRREAETSSEYVARVVTAASVDSGPISELAALYREARFSRHDLGDAHRTQALNALRGVVAALHTSTEVPT